MEAIFTTFGIDWHILLVQGVNFGILLAGLWYFLYGPILRMLEERRSKVAQGVEDAEAAGARLKEIEGARAHTLAEAGKEADELIAQARVSASAKEREIVSRAEAAAGEVAKEAEAQAREAKAKALAESKEEVAKMIVLGMERMLAKK
jgi:F-type H+-transporting ATPase subunit b